ncbi:MAG: hypothetical protein KDB07_06460, partial [Planctomycetes bacterium]|nr:hypothetical protein [Planctomycetota bacterium]
HRSETNRIEKELGSQIPCNRDDGTVVPCYDWETNGPVLIPDCILSVEGGAGTWCSIRVWNGVWHQIQTYYTCINNGLSSASCIVDTGNPAQIVNTFPRWKCEACPEVPPPGGE